MHLYKLHTSEKPHKPPLLHFWLNYFTFADRTTVISSDPIIYDLIVETSVLGTVVQSDRLVTVQIWWNATYRDCCKKPYQRGLWQYLHVSLLAIGRPLSLLIFALLLLVRGALGLVAFALSVVRSPVAITFSVLLSFPVSLLLLLVSVWERNHEVQFTWGNIRNIKDGVSGKYFEMLLQATFTRGRVKLMRIKKQKKEKENDIMVWMYLTALVTVSWILFSWEIFEEIG